MKNWHIKRNLVILLIILLAIIAILIWTGQNPKSAPHPGPEVTEEMRERARAQAAAQEKARAELAEKVLSEHLFDADTPRIAGLPDMIRAGGLSSIFDQDEIDLLYALPHEPPSHEIENVAEWVYENAPILELRRKDGSIAQIRACDTENIVKVEAFGKDLKIHHEALPYLEPVVAEWERRGGTDFYQIPFPAHDTFSVSSYGCRFVAGTTKVSNHAYGLSVDINPPSNPFVLFVDNFDDARGLEIYVDDIPVIYRPPTVWVRTEDKQVFVDNLNYYTDMPWDFINIWKQNGWGWGGNWRSKKDAMHFSLECNEGGKVVACD